MHLRVAALIVLALIAILTLLWTRADRDPVRSPAAPASETAVVPTAEAPLDVDSAAKSTSIAADLQLPPPVDLDAADRDLDLFGRVVTEHGVPVPGARVECVHRPGRRTSLLDVELHAEAIVQAEILSAEDGTFAFRLARGDLRELRVTHPEHAETCVPGCQAGERVQVVLYPGARIELRTIDESGASVPNVEVRLWYHDGGSVVYGDRLLRTDENGLADFSGLSPGSTRLALQHAELGSPRWQNIELAVGETAVREVVMPTGRTVTGSIRDRETGQPIAGARIGEGWTMHRVVRSDELGRYRLTGFARQGVVDITVEAPGFGRETATVPEEEGGPIDFELERGNIAVGTVLDPAGAPLAGLRVHAIAQGYFDRRNRVDPRRAVTGADGTFRIDSLHPRIPHALVILPRGYARVLLDFDGSLRGPDGVIELGPIVLSPPLAIEGELVDAAGLPVTGANIELLGQDPNRNRLRAGAPPIDHLQGREESRRTDDLGRFRFPDLSSGEYTLTARPAGRLESRAALSIDGDEPEPTFVRIVLEDDPEFRIALRTPEGEPVAGARVSASAGRDQRSVVAATDDDGIALFAGFTKSASVRIDAPRGFLTPEEFSVEPMDQTETVVLARASLISGTVLAPDGLAFPGMEVTVSETRPDGEVQSSSRRAGSDGEFEFAVGVGARVDIDCTGVRWIQEGGNLRQVWLPLTGALRDLASPAEGVQLQLVELPTDRRLRARVLGPGEEPLAGVVIRASTGSHSLGKKTATDVEGLATLAGLPACEIRLYCGIPKVALGEGSAWIQPEPARVIPDGQEIVFRLQIGSVLHGTVVDAAGAVVDGIRIRAVTSKGRELTWGGPGRFQLRLLDDETVEITVEATWDGKRLRGQATQVAADAPDLRIVIREE